MHFKSRAKAFCSPVMAPKFHLAMYSLSDCRPVPANAKKKIRKGEN